MQCIYCGADLGPNTRPAHIVPKGMGGRLASKTTCCNDCNNSFSGTEGDACLRLAAHGALAMAKRGDNRPVSAIIEVDGSKFRAENGRLDGMGGPIRDGGRIVPMPARRKDQVYRIAKALCDRGWPPEAMLDGRFYLESEPNVPPVPEVQTKPIESTLKWGDRPTKRVMTKMALELLAHFDHHAATSDALHSARAFARYDQGDLRASPNLETDGAGLAHVEAIWVHAIEIWTAGRKLHYRLTVFTELRFVGTLTEAWDRGPLRGVYSFDARAPADWNVISDASDGATLVNRSYRLRVREFEVAVQRLERRSYENSERRAGRAPKPDFEDLYPDVVKVMAKMCPPK